MFKDVSMKGATGGGVHRVMGSSLGKAGTEFKVGRRHMHVLQCAVSTEHAHSKAKSFLRAIHLHLAAALGINAP